MGEQNYRLCYIVAATEGAAWLYEQLRGFRDRYNLDVTAIISSPTSGIAEKLKEEKIRFLVWDFKYSSLHEIWELPKKITGLAKLLAKEKFDIVQTHLFHSIIIGRMAAWLAEIPVRFSMIAGPFHLEAYTPRWLDRSIAWMDTKIIASCKYTYSLYKKMGVKDKKLALIYYGPDEKKFDPGIIKPSQIREEFGWTMDTPLIAMVAYFYPKFHQSTWVPKDLWGKAGKGHDYLIRAMPKILDKFPKTKCLLIGSAWAGGGEENLLELKELARSLHIENSVIFTGFRSDINGILKTVDIAVQPTLNENLGGTIESLLMECPTVASRVGGIVDSIIDKKTGILVNPKDPDDIARGIIELLNDPGLGKRLAKYGRKYMLGKFTLNQTVEDLYKLYSSGLSSNKQRKKTKKSLSFLRLIIFYSLSFYLFIRLVLIDTFLMNQWSMGWRPWHIPWHIFSIRLISIARVVYCALCRLWCSIMRRKK